MQQRLTDNSSARFAGIEQELAPVLLETRVVADGDVDVVEDAETRNTPSSRSTRFS